MIPRVLHQIWVGPAPAPGALIDSWRRLHPGWEHKLWTCERGWETQARIDSMPEWNGKADIMRYEILEREGGIVVDADSECVEPLDDSFLSHEAFAAWENELVRPGLIATGTVGARKGSTLMRACIDRIRERPLRGRAWECVGPAFFTQVAAGRSDLHVYPSRVFIPEHFSGALAPGTATIRARQHWGSTLGYDRLTGCRKLDRPRARVSLCMIVRDEEAGLEECLASVRDVVDEVIVVDTGSTDRTREIAAAFGARVFDFPWCDDFSAARNESLRHATGDWILWMDADDRLTAQGAGALRRLIDGLGDERAAYLMRVASPAPGWQTSLDTMHVRLFRRDERIRWRYRVHEQVGLSVQACGDRLRQTDIVFMHLGYARPRAMQPKLERNLRLVDLDLAEHPLDGYLLYLRASTLAMLGRSAEALVAVNLAHAAAGGRSTDRALSGIEARALAMEGDLYGALQAVRDARERSPVDPGLATLEARALAALGEWAGAEAVVRQEVLAGGLLAGPLEVTDSSLVAVRGRQLLGEILVAAGRHGEAEGLLRELVAARPFFGPGWAALGEAMTARGDWAGLEALLGELAHVPGSAAQRALLRAERAAMQGAHDEASAILQGELADHPAEGPVPRARVHALYRRGVRGRKLDDAIAAALAVDPFCMRTRVIERATRGTYATIHAGGPAPATHDAGRPPRVGGPRARSRGAPAPPPADTSRAPGCPVRFAAAFPRG